MKRIVTSIIILSFLTGLIGLSSCRREDSLDANQDRIYTYYELVYDANEDITTAKAIFRLGNSFSSKLNLSEGSNVTFNGQELSYNVFYAYYQNEIPGFISNGTFVFTDLNGKTFTNQVNINEIEFPQDMEDIEKGSAYEFTWIGDALEEDEMVSFQIDGPGESDTHSKSISGIGTHSILLSADDTQKYGDGASILSLERSLNNSEINAPSVGGKVLTKYKASKVGMTVSED